jgi:Fe-S cluster assembly protein SufD
VFSDEVKSNTAALLYENRFPTSKDEYWKYTRVTRSATRNFSIEKGNLQDVKAYKIANLDATSLVFVNGFFSPELSDLDALGDELSVYSHSGKTLNDQGNQVQAFDQLNTLFATDGVHLVLGKGKKLEKPLELIHIATNESVMSTLHHHIELDQHAEAELVMCFYSHNACHSFSNVRTSIHLGNGAHLSVSKIQQESNENFHIATEEVTQKENSNFTINTITLGGELVRNNLNIRVEGQNCETNLNAAYVLKENQHVDNHTLVDHLVANCQSNELYKGVIDDRATAVFNGKVFVRQDAQKINAFQSNGNVLLSDDATVNSKPELEIYADDVKCSHGSTTGQLDEQAIFYLRSRGLGEKQARALLVQAFIGDVLEQLSEPLKAHVEKELEVRFGWDIL